MLARLRTALDAPVDIASLAAFRILLGGLLFVSIARLWAKGLIASEYVEPGFLFRHYRFAWLPAPGQGAYLTFAALLVLALCLTIGLYTRASAALFCLLFSYVHLLDQTHYLNHYYQVSLLTFLLALSPAGNLGSVDAWRARGTLPTHMPAWLLHLFRFQVGVVYFFAGLAKLGPDWLVLGQPLRTWLAANTEIPLLGPLFAQAWFAVGMSWLAAFYDLTIPLWLSLRRTRPLAYLAVVVFHLLTARLFEIGMFPYLMMVSSLLFMSPSWPRRWLFGSYALPAIAKPLVGGRALFVSLYVALQLLVPLRCFLYPGNTLWTEQGYRFAWRVMLMEKTGATELTLVDRQTGARRTVFPRTYLTRSQTKAMATQPDMILAFAKHLAALERARGRDVAVYADALAVLNGRRPAPLIAADVDLTQVEDGFADKPWITRRPASP